MPKPALRVLGLAPLCSWYGGEQHQASTFSRACTACVPCSRHRQLRSRHQWPKAQWGEYSPFLWGHWSSPWSPATKLCQHACRELPWCDATGNGDHWSDQAGVGDENAHREWPESPSSISWWVTAIGALWSWAPVRSPPDTYGYHTIYPGVDVLSYQWNLALSRGRSFVGRGPAPCNNWC